MPKTAIIGIGNILMGDEGVGVHAVEYLRSEIKVDLLDGGTGGMALLHILEKYEEAIIIDAVDFGGRPGEVRTFAIERSTPKTDDEACLPAGRQSREFIEFRGLPRSSACGGRDRNDTRFISLTADTSQISLHATSLTGILELAKRLGIKLPKITLIAVQPEKMEPKIELSESVKKAMVKIQKEIKKILDL